MVRNAPLAAILVADVVGYSRRMKIDEARTMAFVERAFARARQGSRRFGGRVVKTTGDGWIALFDSVSGALDCAIVLQRLALRTVATSELTLRVSVHVGEVLQGDEEYFGHALNVAVRMQPLAEPGGIVVSQQVVRQLDHSPRYLFEAIGHPLLKNIGDDLALYRLRPLALRDGADRARPGLRLHILGNLRIIGADGEELTLASAHAAALVGVLALEPDRPFEADRLAAMLWPDKPLARGRAALARTRRLANSRIAPHLVVARGGLVSLNTAKAEIEIDLQSVLRALDEGTVPEPLRTGLDLPGEILAGTGAISPTLQAWLTVRRTIWRDRIIARLESCLERHPAESPSLRAAAEVLLRLEPGHEPASRALMRHLAGRGRKEAALIELERLTRHLRALGTRPGAATAQLAAAMRDCGPMAAAAPAPAAAPRVPQLAIGGFEWELTDAHSVAEQFRTDLIANLSRFRNWAVLDLMDEEPGGADYLLLARQAGTADAMRLQVRLLETRSRRIAWGEAFALSAADWRETQSRVIGRVASALEIYISSDRLSQVVGHVPTEIADYDTWLRGEALLLRWTPEADAEAQAIFERLIERAPAFAPSHASLASIMNVRHILQPGKADARHDSAAAHACAMRAVELDPMDARNHLALSWSAALAGRFDQAAVHLDLATTLNPYSPTTMISAAMGHAFLGDHIRSGDILDQAVRLSPMLRPYQWCYAAAVRCLGGNPEAAEAAALRSGDQIIDNQGWLAVALVRQGRLTEARAAFVRLTEAVSRCWAGPGACDAAAVHAWFVHAYPIRRDTDRAAISDALAAAMTPDAARHGAPTGIRRGQPGTEA